MATPHDIFLGFRFDLRFDAASLGGFSECTGLTLDFQPLQYSEGGRNGETLSFPTRGTQTNIVLKRGVANRQLWDWYAMLLQGRSGFRRSVSIQILDSEGSGPTAEYVLSRAFPCQWKGPDLNASQSSVAVESLTLCHEGLTWQDK